MRRAFLTLLALAYAGATLFYVGVWIMASLRSGPTVGIGFEGQFEPRTRALRVDSVYPGLPAEHAGLRPGDRIVAFDGVPLADANTQPQVWAGHQAGDSIRLTIERDPGAPRSVLVAVFRSLRPGLGGGNATENIAARVQILFPVPFVVVGLTVLFLRLESPVVWLLALLFGCFAAAPDIPPAMAALPLGLALGYQLLMIGLVGPLFYWLFSVFPTRSPLDRRVPWLKGFAVAFGLTLVIAGLPHGRLRLPPPLPRILGEEVAVRAPFWFVFGFILLGLVSLAWNRFATRDADVLRRIRVIFWGTTVGVAPSLLLAGAEQLVALRTPNWLAALINVLVLSVFPLSFAYAILKHRVLDIPVLLQRSARYLLVQRGFNALLAAASVGLTVVFALAFARYVQVAHDIAQPLGVGLGAVLGGGLLWGGSRIQRQVGSRIDRAFFRSAYDARQVLEDLARRTAVATGRAELAQMLEEHVREALRPTSLFVYLRSSDGHLTATGAPHSIGTATLSEDLPVLRELAERGECWEARRSGPDDAVGRSPLGDLRPECLVPVLGRESRLVGVLVLGPRLSEEPYSGEDKRLLLSAARQSGIALETIRLAEEIGERMEAERRVAREIDIAREVQGRLLPQSVPHLQSAELAARCIQARSVGGDYYDFLDLGPGHVGLVLADVSGKGVHAALRMANLQAHLRSQAGIAPQDPLRALRQVNRMLCESTDSGSFATLFLGVYADASRRLAYINCGHNPPVCLRADGSIELLKATATVIGAFEDWECSLGRTQLAPGDVLVAYSDGITEASNASDQFGEARLLDVLRSHSHLPPEELLSAVLACVREFSAGAQSDDLTLLVARAR